MSTSHLKYRLQELLNDLPRGVNVGTVAEMLDATYGIPTLTFYRHRTIKADSPHTMSAAALESYAKFFDVPMEELITKPEEPEPKKKTIYELLNTPKRIKTTTIAELTGMAAPE